MHAAGIYQGFFGGILRWQKFCLQLDLAPTTFIAAPNPQKLAEMKLHIFSHKTWSDKLGGISGEDLWVIL